MQRRDRSKRQILYPDSFLYGNYYSNLPDRYQYPFYALPDTGLDSTEEKHRLSIAVKTYVPAKCADPLVAVADRAAWHKLPHCSLITE